MSCSEIRDRLASGSAGAPEVSAHLERCEACSRYSARVSAARRIFREHHANVEPDIHFADRVVAHLGLEAGPTLGWAARRVLPATFALLLVLAWMSWQATLDSAPSVLASPTEDPLGWVLDPTGFGS